MRNRSHSNHLSRPVTTFRPAVVVEGLEDRRLFSTVVAVSGRDLLVFFDSSTPNKTLERVKVHGLARKESIVALDYRPANKLLYALGDTSRLYRIDVTTGLATAVSSNSTLTEIGGTTFGMDFNPTVDRVRIVSDADQNVRLDPDTGAVVDFDSITAGTQTDLSLAYASGDVNAGSNPSVTSIAYSNNFAGSTQTTLYGIDSDTNSLVRIGSADGTTDSPNNGAVSTIGALNIDVTAVSGFDIDTDGSTNTAYAMLSTGEKSRSGLYTIDLATGASTKVGDIQASRLPLGAMTIVPKADEVVALDKSGKLYTFTTALPNIVSGKIKVKGLEKREKLISIDRRPSDGLIYAFTDQSRLYTVNPQTGNATAVGGQAQFSVAKKAQADIDFNPVVDKLRLADSASENLRIDPATGQVIDFDPALADVQLDGPLVYDSTDTNASASPSVVGVAYNNAVSGAAATTLYAIDSKLDVLTTIGTPNGTIAPDTGRIFTVGSLGVNVKSEAGFDIVSGNSETAYAAFRESRGGSSLYTINLASGAATKAGALAKGVVPVAITIVPAT